MPRIPAFVPLVTATQILNGPDNLSFSQLYSLVNNVNGNGLDSTNIGTAGINASLFNGNGAVGAGSWNITGTLSVGGNMSTSNSANTALSASTITSGALAIGRDTGGAAVLWLGGSTSSGFLSYNLSGLNELNFSAPVFAGYYNSVTAATGWGNLTPVLQSNGTDAGATRVVRGQVLTVTNGQGNITGLPFTSSTSYIIICTNNNSGNPYQIQAWPTGGSTATVQVFDRVAPFFGINGVPVNFVAIGS